MHTFFPKNKFDRNNKTQFVSNSLKDTEFFFEQVRVWISVYKTTFFILKSIVLRYVFFVKLDDCSKKKKS